MIIITQANESRDSKTFICPAFMCLFVHMAEQTQATWTLPYTHLILGQRSRLQGHKVEKHIADNQVAGMSLHSIVWPASSKLSLPLFFLIIIIIKQSALFYFSAYTSAKATE